MKGRFTKVLGDILADRGDFFRVILIGSCLAIGVNLFTAGLESIINLPVVVMILGVLVLILSISFLAFRVFGERKLSKKVEAVVFYDRKTKGFIPVRDYEFAEDISNQWCKS